MARPRPHRLSQPHRLSRPRRSPQRLGRDGRSGGPGQRVQATGRFSGVPPAGPAASPSTAGSVATGLGPTDGVAGALAGALGDGLAGALALGLGDGDRVGAAERPVRGAVPPYIRTSLVCTWPGAIRTPVATARSPYTSVTRMPYGPGPAPESISQ
ncbi:hypothetical protein [Micromonospora fluostatini]|uniref:hypothetical protein n=1 Tax=Micromonospora sp. JCM 30529 TaxID=3421643 RepID=UPI003D174047